MKTVRLLGTFLVCMFLSGYVLTHPVRADEDCNAIADDMRYQCEHQGGQNCDCMACMANGICLGLDNGPARKFCQYTGWCDLMPA
jgi:hypothetical protein